MLEQRNPGLDLAGEPDVDALLEERAEGHRLAHRPVYLPRLHHVAPAETIIYDDRKNKSR